ncbi:hypothetical protein PHYSODRAFT_265365 [Phytophthora sojae]|uniref:RxLR effector protein n=1 Tax=Phytophthora sojae (strain P6497) TaxID=1094619 RepID=G4ZLX8_PHYSP|nr:hypothetical protein PHYSODRAFT_265365 [Phytophthora sojae]EGZ15313.1 hypothetical protein PHYSODRAFT_265365 [Phytophthora sojae]|eukprot:XP_009529062.1 hypothetical protein PHYSODRAFT_265365 [Phytophthora sojae]
MRFTVHTFLLAVFALTNNADTVDTEDSSVKTYLTEKGKSLTTNATIKAWLAFGKSDEQVMKALDSRMA